MKIGLCGIYMIRNKSNGKIWIGQAKNTKIRWRVHKRDFKRNKNSPHLQNAWNEYGEDAFEFVVLEQCECKKEVLCEREQYWLDFYQSYDHELGYNIAKIAGSCLGVKRSEETKEKIRQLHLGRKASQETKEKLRSRIISEETREKLSIAAGGKKRPPWVKQKIKENHKGFKGKKHSLDAKQKIAAKMAQRELSEEHKRKIGMSQRGEKSNKAKLTYDQVDEIRTKYALKNVSYRTLAKEYKVSSRTIERVVKRICWKEENL